MWKKVLKRFAIGIKKLSLLTLIVIIINLCHCINAVADPNWTRPDICSLPVDEGININGTDFDQKAASVEKYHLNSSSEKCEIFRLIVKIDEQN